MIIKLFKSMQLLTIMFDYKSMPERHLRTCMQDVLFAISELYKSRGTETNRAVLGEDFYQTLDLVEDRARTDADFPFPESEIRLLRERLLGLAQKLEPEQFKNNKNSPLAPIHGLKPVVFTVLA